MQAESTIISVAGKPVRVPSANVEDRHVIVTGRGLRMALFKSEDYADHAPITNLERFLTKLRAARLPADIFTFTQAIDQPEPLFPDVYHEPDNVAAIPLAAGYKHWWEELSQESRRNVRIAEKKGVKIEVVPFDDKLVRGIKGIYDETPIRQGRKFWHYGKDVETVRKDNASFVDRADFIAAYCEEDLIGFIKVVYVGKKASVMQILSKNATFAKRPANAMIAKAVELACAKGMDHLVYCKYEYGNKGNTSIAEFKRRNGFVQLNFPRYFVPLSLKGRMAIGCRLHKGLKHWIPTRLTRILLDLRTKAYERSVQAPKAA